MFFILSSTFIPISLKAEEINSVFSSTSTGKGVSFLLVSFDRGSSFGASVLEDGGDGGGDGGAPNIGGGGGYGGVLTSDNGQFLIIFWYLSFTFGYFSKNTQFKPVQDFNYGGQYVTSYSGDPNPLPSVSGKTLVESKDAYPEVWKTLQEYVGFSTINGIEYTLNSTVYDFFRDNQIPFTSENIKGIAISQIPLVHAWALTIHKSQGATLDAAEIDVGSGIFECGQTYVALSRVKSLEGLYLTSFDAKRIRINKKVKEYYDALTAYHSSSPPPIIQTIEEFKYKEEEELKEEPIDPDVKVVKILG